MDLQAYEDGGPEPDDEVVDDDIVDLVTPIKSSKIDIDSAKLVKKSLAKRKLDTSVEYNK